MGSAGTCSCRHQSNPFNLSVAGLNGDRASFGLRLDHVFAAIPTLVEPTTCNGFATIRAMWTSLGRSLSIPMRSHVHLVPLGSNTLAGRRAPHCREG